MELLVFGSRGWGDELALGALHTVVLAVTALPLGIFLGLLIAFSRHSADPGLRRAGNLLSTLFRGMPELLTILLAYILGQRLLDAASAAAGLQAAVDVSVFGAGVAALALVFAAYASEVFLGALQAMSGSLLQAAAALGMGPWVTLRFVTLPELFRLSAPGLSNLWLSLLKHTSLVSVVGYSDLMHYGQIAASSTGERLFFYTAVFGVYLMLCSVAGPLFERTIARISARVPGRAER